ncbi:ATP-dependent helicase [Mesorhizobium sp. KR2-14]|uniref:ATP-dependent helicase n=1 Tax=Mesorhizobium sp. KR2-14 TaxID=3156610 RepID=UPI0032B50EB8
MTDEEVAALLRSDAALVVIEAPAGCGKTYQAAQYAAYAGRHLKQGKVLILTHTHAACSVVAKATRDCRRSVNIRTLDSLIHQVATAYHLALSLPSDVSQWIRENSHEKLAEKVADFLDANPSICLWIAMNYPVVICDEHQDASIHQDRIVHCLGNSGAALRIFGDPMQCIPGGRTQDAVEAEVRKRWDDLKTLAGANFGELETPHRWAKTNPALGDWILQARDDLKNGRPVTLPDPLPRGLRIIRAENDAVRGQPYQLAPQNWTQIDGLVDAPQPAFFLAKAADIVDALRRSFRRRIAIWEGLGRDELDRLVVSATSDSATAVTVTQALVDFVQTVISRFSNSAYANRLAAEVQNPTASPRGDIPPHLKSMALLLRNSPDCKGCSAAAAYLRDLIRNRSKGFTDLQIDYPSQLADLIRLGEFDDPAAGLLELSQRRARAYPSPPAKSLSTIHKAKGLEAHRVSLFALDGVEFTERQTRRNLLYVALSRATSEVVLVVSDRNPTPLIVIP